MGHFGEELRNERESRGIALENITDSTKISSRHLLALEREDFLQLPGGVFNKGIVRGYARVVGLDEDAWVNRYLSAYRERVPEAASEDPEWVEFAENVVKSRKPGINRSSLHLRWAGVFLLVMLVAAFGWFVYQFVEGKVAAGLTPAVSHVSRSVSGLNPRLSA